MRSLKNFALLLAVMAISSCSKDSLEEHEEIAAPVCQITEPGEACSVVFLEGKDEWIKIPDPGQLEDPYFLYAVGETDDPHGTVTVSLQNGGPVFRINDTALQDYLIMVSQDSHGTGMQCQAAENVTPPTSEDDPYTSMEFPGDLAYPFYVKIRANVCP